MDKPTAQEILLRYRPGTSDAQDPEVQEALTFAAGDPELSQWLERQLATASMIRGALRSIPVPAGLQQSILDGQRLQERRSFKPRVWVRLAIAASVLLLGTLLALQLNRPNYSSFPDFRDRMVRTARRSYRMDMLSADMGQIRAYLAQKKAYEDFALPHCLQQLPGVGCAILRWHDRPVSLVCLDSPEHTTLYLFVTARSHLSKEPGSTIPEIENISSYGTASWSDDSKTYVLASADPGVLKRLRL